MRTSRDGLEEVWSASNFLRPRIKLPNQVSIFVRLELVMLLLAKSELGKQRKVDTKRRYRKELRKKTNLLKLLDLMLQKKHTPRELLEEYLRELEVAVVLIQSLEFWAAKIEL